MRPAFLLTIREPLTGAGHRIPFGINGFNESIQAVNVQNRKIGSFPPYFADAVSSCKYAVFRSRTGKACNKPQISAIFTAHELCVNALIFFTDVK